MSHARMPFSAPVNESLRNNALTAFLALETLILFVGAPLAAVGFQAPVFLGGLLGVPVLLAIVIISRSTAARAMTVVATVLAIGGVIFRISHPSVITVWLGHLAVIAAVLGISVVVVQAVFAQGRITHHASPDRGRGRFVSEYRADIHFDFPPDPGA